MLHKFSWSNINFCLKEKKNHVYYISIQVRNLDVTKMLSIFTYKLEFSFSEDCYRKTVWAVNISVYLYHYLVILCDFASVLVNWLIQLTGMHFSATDDIPHADEIRTLVKDIWDLRIAKLRSSIDTFVKSDATHAKVWSISYYLLSRM